MPLFKFLPHPVLETFFYSGEGRHQEHVPLLLGVRMGKNIYLQINRVLWTWGFLFIF